MDWLSQNWIWVLVFAAFIGMHLFGHGGHGGRAGHGGCCGGDEQRGPADKDEQGADQPHGHHH
jgi:hypothetical protein